MLPIHSFGSFRLFIILSRFVFRTLIPETKGEPLSDNLPPICDETEDMRFIEQDSKGIPAHFLSR